MITLIIKSYLAILLSIGIASLSILCLGLYWIFRKARTGKRDSVAELPKTKNVMTSASHDLKAADFSAIAGEDVMATQLDLARAYIETGKKQSAKTILAAVVAQGSATQQQEARHLQRFI